MRKMTFVLIGILLLSTIVGCSTSSTKTFKDEDGEAEVKVDENKGSIKFKNEKSEGSAEVGEDVSLPEDFPEDIPVYDDSKLTFASSTKSDDAQIIVTTFETKDSISEVSDFYKTELEANGYVIESTFETGNVITQTAVKGDDRVIIAATESEGKTTIAINITTEFK